MAAEDDVRQASDRFYAALTSMANGDASSLSPTWADSLEVTAMHPIGGREEGSSQVQASFEGVGSLASGGHVHLEDQLIRVGGDMAYEVGTEVGEITLAGEQIAVSQRVTNIYLNEGGEWKMVHHHSDLSPAMMDLLSRLQQAE